MSANTGDALGQHLLTIKRWALLGALVFLAATANVRAQNTFSSGSTGADGAFSPTTTQTIVVPDSGVFNFTTVNIPSGVTITFARNVTNKPLTILASGDVVIAGTINIDGKNGNTNGSGGFGGPGGFNGGAGGYGFDQSFTGVGGDGPGGGGGGISSATTSLPGSGGGGGFGTNGASGQSGTVSGQAGQRFGTVTILPLIGGSGGGGGGARNNDRGGAGGGGGGAILIASSGTITMNGTILSRGGGAASGNAGGGGGSGGAVRFIANNLNGGGIINVGGGGGGGANVSFQGGAGGQGYIRLEAYDYSAFTGSSTPANIISFAFPHPVTSPNGPSLRIASVGGVTAPTAPLGSLQGVPDVIVPSTQTNPVTVALEAANLPLGTIIQVQLIPSRGARTTVQSTGLAGTEGASTASASVTLPGGISVVSASAVIDLSLAKADPIFIEGERVRRIEVAATFGRGSDVTYITESGRRIKRSTD
ncbi:MAG TPA: hypothetical protein VGD61_08610 [Pyrinomonadaceae bacterium]